MAAEAPMTPAPDAGGGRLGRCEKPSQFPRRWAEAMEGHLPSQVLRPLRDARDRRLSKTNRLAALDSARFALSVRERNWRATDNSLDEMQEKRGVEYVDPSDPAQAAAFVERIDLKALSKSRRIEVAIEVAKLEIERLDKELYRGP
ncbi:hypothetical protein [Novilysobacter erysipheiresistens]|uniref:Uncharacterized protein n=1 Tax=Novilysobacter erysipheiresistens TaxID=1749332 RepID=A0ABU7YTU9_9GAMM